MSQDEPPVIPVPPGAPPGYRGYGITSAAAPEPVPEPLTASAEADVSENSIESETPDAEADSAALTDSVTLAAPEPAEHDLRDWLLRLPDGSGLLIDGMLLIGRSPDPAQGPPGARLISIDDPARTVSRSHLVIGPSGPGELLARNVSTVNAVVVIGADGTEFKINPGGSVVLVDAARVLAGAYPILLERA